MALSGQHCENSFCNFRVAGQPEGNQTSQYDRVCRYPSSPRHSNIRIAVHADGKFRETSCANNLLLEGHDTSNHGAPETIARSSTTGDDLLWPSTQTLFQKGRPFIMCELSLLPRPVRGSVRIPGFSRIGCPARSGMIAMLARTGFTVIKT